MQPSSEFPFVCLAPSDVESLLSNDDPALDSSFTPLTFDQPAVLEAAQQVATRTETRYPGHHIPESFVLLALELGRRQHGRLDVPSAVLRLKPPFAPVSSSTGLRTRLTLVPAALDVLYSSQLPFLDKNDESFREAMCLLVDAARVQFTRSVVSVHTVYYAVQFSRIRNQFHRIDLDVAFEALQPLSFADTPPTDSDWDFASINALIASESQHTPNPGPSSAVLPASTA
jgi:hypothetical protein